MATFFPESLYQLSERDQKVTWLDPALRTANLQLSATVVTVNLLTVPTDRAFLLQSATALGIPTAGQAVTALGIIARPPSSAVNIRIHQENFPIVASQQRNVNWSGSLILPPNWLLVCIGEFDIGAAANLTILDAIGMFIPSGNIQRV